MEHCHRKLADHFNDFDPLQIAVGSISPGNYLGVRDDTEFKPRRILQGSTLAVTGRLTSATPIAPDLDFARDRDIIEIVDW